MCLIIYILLFLCLEGGLIIIIIQVLDQHSALLRLRLFATLDAMYRREKELFCKVIKERTARSRGHGIRSRHRIAHTSPLHPPVPLFTRRVSLRANPWLLTLFPAKHHRPRLPRVLRSGLELRRMYPGLLGPLDPFWRDVRYSVALTARELPSSESACALGSRLVRRDLGRRFCYNPILGSTRDFVCANLDEAASFDWEEVARGKNFDIDDGEDAVEDVVRVDFAGDDFFALVVDFFNHLFLDNSFT